MLIGFHGNGMSQAFFLSWHRKLQKRIPLFEINFISREIRRLMVTENLALAVVVEVPT